MPPRRATALAEHGPTAYLLVLIGVALLWAGLEAVLGEGLLPRSVRAVAAVGVGAVFCVLVLYQGVFMVLFPRTAVDRSIAPPQPRRARPLFDNTPETPSQARTSGLLTVLAVLGVFVVAVVVSL